MSRYPDDRLLAAGQGLRQALSSTQSDYTELRPGVTSWTRTIFSTSIDIQKSSVPLYHRSERNLKDRAFLDIYSPLSAWLYQTERPRHLDEGVAFMMWGSWAARKRVLLSRFPRQWLPTTT